MNDISGVELALFGPVSLVNIDTWLAGIVHDHLDAELRKVIWRSGRIDAVYGLWLTDDRKVVLKVRRGPVDLPALEASLTALRYLSSTGYPCPAPVAGPFLRDGHTVTIEALLERGKAEDARRPAIRRAMASSLVEHIRILRAVGHLAPRLRARPAWTRYSNGPWPVPHDPIFNFTTTPAGWEWLDTFARQASDALVAVRRHDQNVIGHGDWYGGNLRFENERVVATFDWDLMVESEAVLAGLTAGGYLAEGAPTPEEVAAFLVDFEEAREEIFIPDQQRSAVAGACWVLAFNARCDLFNSGGRVEIASALDRLGARREEYRRISW